MLRPNIMAAHKDMCSSMTSMVTDKLRPFRTGFYIHMNTRAMQPDRADGPLFSHLRTIV